MKSALLVPFVKVERDVFLRKELSVYCSGDYLDNAVIAPTKFLDKKIIDKIADGCIKNHLTYVCSVSALAGIPGGWALAGTIPADLAQFYAQVLVLTQKLIYLYGWPDLTTVDGELDDETTQILTLFIGVMMGSVAASNGLKQIGVELAKEVAKRLPKQALTKYAVYNIAKQCAKWIGVKLTKQTFSRRLAKIIPLIGAPISATVTYITFKPMAIKLKEHLDEIYELNLKTTKVGVS